MEKYIKNKWYEGLGEYNGVVTIYPYKKNYIIKAHRFVDKSPGNNKCGEINEIEIERIKR